ncbi:hypothetical protein U876_03650 [Aeromonas hydrophila NJ-35]|nr:hypothetical protein AHML_18855 [Aeromonas hydrophila ML09-119]AHX34155.1 hypothetical protein V428_19595 [Aeromonas hydrophila subsp. hydrophila AL09-71]AHX70956.1 hypothetical protein V429_19625 [Aeromonas hydrophila pc104A]AJE35064.1 hypothetical protein V469_03680 [Aeromonas hydrophila J-1]AKJ33260.1 hypothetical protein U876_03650 [Aeromonas hydrophila NJ-35]ALQ62084.1 hypothetical protein AS145_03900 [Aeromonas hydrophila]
MRNWLKTLLFVSSFSPTLLVLAGVRYYSVGTFDSLVVQLSVISMAGILLPFLILELVKKEAQRESFSAKKVESADYYLLVFLASYASPVVMKIAEINFFMAVMTISLIFVVAWFVSNIPSHPILYLFKFRFYKIESNDGMVYTLITKRVIRSPRDVTRVMKLSSTMIME